MRKYFSLLTLLMWVLWTRTSGSPADNWTATTGFGTQEKCQENMKEKLDVWRKFKDATFSKNSVTFAETNSTLTYYCLPDNEDPRKRKDN